jgi:hypothetical protein
MSYLIVLVVKLAVAIIVMQTYRLHRSRTRLCLLRQGSLFRPPYDIHLHLRSQSERRLLVISSVCTTTYDPTIETLTLSFNVSPMVGAARHQFSTYD